MEIGSCFVSFSLVVLERLEIIAAECKDIEL